MALPGRRESEQGLMVTEALLPDEVPFPSTLVNYLYAGHFLARWGARMWEFGVGLYMVSIWPDSLLFAAVYGVVESASTALFGSMVGHWLDRLTYIKILRIWLLTQNLSYIIAGGTMIGLLVYSDLKSTNFTAFVVLVVLTNISGAVAVLSTLAGTILIEREWVVVISQGHPPQVLTKMNSVVRRIDLFSKLFAPVATGFIISFVSLEASAITLVLWNALSVWFQYWLLISVYNGIPSLGTGSQRRITRHQQIAEDQESLLSHNNTDSAVTASNWRDKTVEWVMSRPFIQAWAVYLQQDVVLPGVALALLFFTVLSFGTLMTAALETEGIPAFVIGIARGISATIGIAATLVYPALQSRISTLRTGLWSIWSQWTFLLLCVASVWVPSMVTSAYMLMAGVATSRLGLWMFDLSVMQQMQDHVPESDRCVVGGVQNSLQSAMELLSYVMGIIISSPQDFWKLTMLSFSAVTVAALLYSLHLYRMSTPGKGILAAVESTGTIGKRLSRINVEFNRRALRELLFCTPGALQFLSGVILFEETLYQSTAAGKPFVEVMKEAGVLPGIKVLGINSMLGNKMKLC